MPNELAAFAKRYPFEIYSTRRQIERYTDWLGELLKAMGKTAEPFHITPSSQGN